MGVPELVLASGNAHKFAEISAALGPSLRLIRPASLGSPPKPEEWGERFAVNAAIKAIAFAVWAGRPALADDSGLEVDALGGAPGVRSARFAGEGASDEANNRLLLERMEGESNRCARFRCVLALARPALASSDEAGDAVAPLALSPPIAIEDVPEEGACRVRTPEGLWEVTLVSGAVEGRIAHDLRGTQGFGYDPLFELRDGRRMAELSRAEKEAVSHRGAALAALRRCGVPTLLPALGEAR